ncbi:MAG: alpha-L-glutamate ligase [Proteobacteria bacterium]|nr:alpha-L-glutamate ligase [Pseudomonadota bacterium]
MSKIYIIHENPQWFAPLAKVFTEHKLPYGEIFMEDGSIDTSKAPPEGIFFSKMSASSYTRDHKFSPDYTAALLTWLEASGRRVINGSSVLRLEMSKIDQYIRLEKAGIKVPRAVACFGKNQIKEAAKTFQAPFILKPNRGGKGIGVQLFQSHKMLEEYLNSGNFEPSVDNVTLVQEYIQAPEPFITRMEFIGGKFVYAVRVDTSQGFELCPAEACRVDTPGKANEVCAIDAGEGLFRIMKDFNDPIIGKLEKFLKATGIEVAGIEFIRDKNNQVYVYDINTNTNYNPEAEQKAGVSAITKLTEFLRAELNNAGKSKNVA